MAEKEKKKNSERWIELIIVVVCLGLAFLFSMSKPGQLIDLKFFDMMMIMKPKPAEWDKILYMDISDKSIDIIGRFPWPRQTIGEGIEIIKEFNADKILFDIEFIDPSLAEIDEEYYTELIQSDTNPSVTELIDELIIEPDKEMLKSMLIDSEQNVYLACRGVEETRKETADLSSQSSSQFASIISDFFYEISDYSITNKIPGEKYLEYPVYPLYLGAAGMGFTSVNFSELDGILRRVNLFRTLNDYLIPQLALPVLIDEMGIDMSQLEINPGKYIKFVLEDGETIKVPINENGEMIINWSNPWEDSFGTHLEFHELLQYQDIKETVQIQKALAEKYTLSSAQQEVLDYNIEQYESAVERLSLMEDKIVIVGVSATSADDMGSIPIDAVTPMVITHANIMNTIYQRVFLFDAPWYVNWVIIIVLTMVLAIMGAKIRSASKETIFSAILILVLFGLYYLSITLWGMVLHYSLTLIALLLTFISLIIFKFILYDKQKNYIKSAFMSYLSPEVVEQVIDNPELLKLGGNRMEITAYFSDVQGFTSISEELTPEEIVHLLNEYLTAMSEIILSYGGTVDKYEGDAVVAFFGAPIPHKDHAKRCCSAAIDMRDALISLRKKWVDEGYPEIYARMGMNSGYAIIGNMGSQSRMNYTMMGDTVNLASRLEGANKAYGSFLMISHTTNEKVKSDFITRKLDKLQVVGKKEPITVFELIGRIGEVAQQTLDMLSDYEQALALYDERDWKNARIKFETLHEKYNDPPSLTYMKRCEHFIKNPPSKDWDGVFVLKSK